jgi:ABC-type polysaccharide/polyol phosphate transport system ATPase subunit
MIDLKFDHVSKRYLVPEEDAGDRARHPVVRKLLSLRRRPREFWAVKDVSFEVERGEAVGIIGHNGAGKSTILKLLSSITTPTEGEITINGRLSALIEVGSGFHPELTGRENVYLNGSILGMRRREITKKLDSIVDFAGVKQFIDTPVKRYSSGMYVRLGFSIAAHLNPDILLLDEVLAVGDTAFQSKCLKRIGELKQGGVTIAFISHDLSAVERLCDRVLLVKQGKIVANGAPRDVIAKYQQEALSYAALEPLNSVDKADVKQVELTSLIVADEKGCETNAFRTGVPFKLRIRYDVRERIDDAVFEVFVTSVADEQECQFTTELSGERIALEPGTGMLEFTCAELGLQPNNYLLHVLVKERDAPDSIDWRPACAMFRVDPGKIVYGRFYMPHEWRLLSVTGDANDRQEKSTDEFASKV